MKSASTHCDAGAYPSSERGSIPKPPVGIAEKAYATALKRLIRSSTPVQPNTARIPIRIAVSAT